MYKRIKKHKVQGKTDSHLRSMVLSQVIELVRAQQIKTTPAKARVLKSKFDRLVTQAKKGTNSSKIEIQSFFRSNPRSMDRFFKVVESQLQDRDSGYTRITKTLPRKGDNAAQVYVTLVNKAEKKEKKSKIEKTLEAQSKKKKVTKTKKTEKK